MEKTAPAAAYVLYEKARALFYEKKYPEAAILFEETQEKADCDFELRARCVRDLLACTYAMAHFQEGIELCTSIEPAFLETFGKKSLWYARLQHIRARFFMKLKEFRKALAAVEQSCRIFEKLQEKGKDYVDALFDMSTIFFELRKWRDCANYCKGVLKLLDERDKKYVPVLTVLAVALRQAGDFAEGFKIQKQVPSSDDHATVAKSLGNMAILYVRLKTPRDAVPLLVEAISILEKNLPVGHPAFVTYLDWLAVARRAVADRDYMKSKASTYRICGNCEKVGLRVKELFPCNQCWVRSYCSVECQTAAWPEHQKICQPGPESPCVMCEKDGCTTRCSKCKKVTYCSKACQIADWKSHKVLCPKWALE